MYGAYGGYYGIDSTYLLVIISVIITIGVQTYMQSTFNKYKNVMSQSGLTAREAAIKIMQGNGITDVQIGRVSGDLTDHYIPSKKQLNLSDTTYDSSSIAAIGVAAHEVGHAIQDHTRYVPLYLQMITVPIVNICSGLSMPVILIGVILGVFGFVKIGLILFSVTLIYQIINLPVEFNASNNAVRTLRENNMMDESEIYVVKKVLFAAGLTYVAAAASTALTLLRFVLIFNRRRD